MEQARLKELVQPANRMGKQPLQDRREVRRNRAFLATGTNKLDRHVLKGPGQTAISSPPAQAARIPGDLHDFQCRCSALPSRV